MSDRIRDKRGMRFSIATLLFLMLCLGGYLSGYLVGFDRGKQGAVDATIYVKSYPVGDLISPSNSRAAASDFDRLIDAIVTTVSPGQWMEDGAGNGEIQPFPANMSLVVSQNQSNHEAISAYFEQLRKTKAASKGMPAAK
jgi:hypothetical protein